MYRHSVLPIPHPLDFEWRFTPGAATSLLDLAWNLSTSGDTLAMIGTPSVFLEAQGHATAQRHLVLLDKNVPALNALCCPLPAHSVLHCDVVREACPEGNAQVVLADPPWYPEQMEGFLEAASRLLVMGGYALFSFPPFGTRPGILEEREKLLHRAQALQLRPIRTDPLALPYASPPFERNALRAEGIRNYPYDWRRGDLVVFRCEGKDTLPSTASLPPGPAWSEECARGIRFRLRPKPATGGFTNPCLASLVPGDVLPTVSTRDSRRKEADVWTPGNRIYRCAGTGTLRTVIRAIEDAEDPIRAVARELGRELGTEEARLVRKAQEQVVWLVETERKEIWGDEV